MHQLARAGAAAAAAAAADAVFVKVPAAVLTMVPQVALAAMSYTPVMGRRRRRTLKRRAEPHMRESWASPSCAQVSFRSPSGSIPRPSQHYMINLDPRPPLIISP